FVMLAINYTNARQKFKDYCDIANNDFETIIVTRKQGGNVVIMSEAEYNNLMENLFIRSNPEYYKEILDSIDQIKRGQSKIRELIEDE
ncbi:MAG: type II toxin-antitoxin system prevent-host-death family antitoxin, partial [Syntrophomonas sp.]|nr:type II toxin-antitoxin system prevent-host-death family antitoxin [Syntrophomonas sp.]